MPAAAGSDSGDAGAGAAAGGSAEKAGTEGPRDRGNENSRDKGTGWAGQERGGAEMTWASFYLICFLVGLILSAFTLLGGMGHFGGGGHVHLPHAPHLHVPHAAHGAHGGAGPHGAATVPWWNAFSIMVFLCWFGAAGYLLTRFGSFVAGVVVLLAGMCGLTGGAIIFLFLSRVL